MLLSSKIRDKQQLVEDLSKSDVFKEYYFKTYLFNAYIILNNSVKTIKNKSFKTI
jgi:hypothetical protein